MTNLYDDSIGEEASSAPFNFSWIVKNQLAAMAWPQTRENLNFLWKNGIKHLVTLSPEKIPPVAQSNMGWTLIDVEEFEPPTLDDIITFINVCEMSMAKNEGVGVHCRMGQGRTGVMAACFLVHFCGLLPQHAIDQVRSQRPWSVETYGQEKAVAKYYDYLRGTRANTSATSS